ncbi:zinc ribbon domain-containing protein [Lewinella sp. IMCC34191]|uniref:zinc ribbon domain-containing protein n=1 Tax=Lewinella sp. IMCC34191 TaxID=2259172 RepID=UPI000E2710DC|nr:C4-type zinc ribbon domain-containing protein [Lewinella sp. IMCC34191]
MAAAAPTDLTVEEKMRELYRLQLIDSQIDEIEILKGELPMEVSDLEDEIAGLETRISRTEGQVDELKTEIGRHEANMKESDMLISRYEEQMNNVKNNREYEALMKETEMQRLEIQLSQKKAKTASEDLEARTATLDATKERRDAKLKLLDVKQEELKSIIAKTEKEEKKLRRQSDKQRKLIEDRLLRAYDKTRNNYRNGLAVVTVERNACGGCFNAIPPQQQLEISQRKRLMACEHCSRVLVDDTILEEEAVES